MTQFVHFFDANKGKRIARSGLLATRTKLEGIKGIYCTPVSKDFYRTHQWLRELKRSGVKTIHAVQFHLDPETAVLVGRYNGDHIEVAATEATSIFNEHTDGLGLEVIALQSVPKSAITRIYQPNQVLGWRIYPEAKGKRPFCGCKFCNRGEINAYRVITEREE